MSDHDQSNQGDEFAGFNEARRIMWCHEIRSRAFLRLSETSFVHDMNVMAVHVNNTTRTDRVFLTAFGPNGQRVGADTLYIDDPTQHLDVAPEFDHDFTRLSVPHSSDMSEAVDRCDGWVINMRALRTYDLTNDRRTTQRAVFLAHLPDLMSAGQVQGFSIGGSDQGSDAA